MGHDVFSETLLSNAKVAPDLWSVWKLWPTGEILRNPNKAGCEYLLLKQRVSIYLQIMEHIVGEVWI